MSALADLLDATGAALEAEDDFDALNRLYCEKGWSDGLPLVPPSEQRVGDMLAYWDRPLAEPVAKIAPRWGEATPVRLAANAVMAGCRPEYFPLFVLAVEALCEESFNLYGIQTTTHQCAPLVMVNGPIGRELAINSGHNAFGPGHPANATIGRAIRLALVNIGGALPGIGDMSTFGSPGKYSYCVAENEAASPWEPLHVERGFPEEATTVTVIGAEGPHNVNDHESVTGKGILTMIAGTMAIPGANDATLGGGEPVIVLGPEHAATVATDGYSKQDVKRFLYEHGQVPLARFSEEYIERRLKKRFPERFAAAGVGAMIPLVKRAEDFMVIVIGGAGKHSAFIPTFGTTRAVTRMLRRRDGQPARSVSELRAQ
jgi:hypothetical protein